MIASLDGYSADEDGNFAWAVPNEAVHAFVNDCARSIGTYLYGRRRYAVMAGWETLHLLPDRSPATLGFAAIWQAADKIAYSTTLTTVSCARTRIVRDFDPAAIRQLKARAARDITVGGPGLAAQALRAGLVDEYHLFVAPVIGGGGTLARPAALRLPLELLAERRFGNGMVYLRYRVKA